MKNQVVKFNLNGKLMEGVIARVLRKVSDNTQHYMVWVGAFKFYISSNDIVC